MTKYKIGTFEAIMIILNVVIIHTIFSLPRDILVTTKSASIINLLYVSIITILFAFFIYKSFIRFPNLDILDLSEKIGGKIFKNIIGTIFSTYFVITASIFLRNGCEWLKTVYYPTTDVTFILLMFIIAICITNRLNLNTTIKTNLLIIPIVLVGIIFIFITNINNFTPQKIFPILGDGFFNTFVTGLGNIVSFSGIVYLYFLPPYLKKQKDLKNISIFSIGISSIYLILVVSTILFMFSAFVLVDEISPLYTVTRYIEFGDFFQRLESLFLLFWILAFACYLSIAIKFLMNIFKKITNIKDEKTLINSFGLLLFSISMFPKSSTTTQSFENQIYPYIVFTIIFGLGFSILLIANLKRIFSSKKLINNQ